MAPPSITWSFLLAQCRRRYPRAARKSISRRQVVDPPRPANSSVSGRANHARRLSSPSIRSSPAAACSLPLSGDAGSSTTPRTAAADEFVPQA